MSTRTLILLADFSFQLGLIDLSEYMGRIEVAHWLSEKGSSTADPRAPQIDEDVAKIEDIERFENSETVRRTGTDKIAEPNWLELVLLSKWYFTRSDPDSYPSTPHGHLNDANRPWPKLNPYTGRAFKAKHQEDTALRLSRSELRAIWRVSAFRDFCRSHILWYIEAHPQHSFKVQHPLRFPRW